MDYVFEIDPTKHDNPDQPNTEPLDPRGKLALTINKQLEGLQWKRSTRLRITAALAGYPDGITSSFELSSEHCAQILDNIFPLWTRDVYYPPMESRIMLRKMGEYFSKQIVSERGTMEWVESEEKRLAELRKAKRQNKKFVVRSGRVQS